MTNEDARAGGSHRRVDRGRRLRVLLVSLLVVVLAGGGVEAALHWRGESKRRSTTAASSSYVSPSATPSGATPSGPSSSPAAAPSSSPPLTYPVTSAPATPTSATAPAGTPSTASPAPGTSTGAAKPLVDILNGTHVSGMAARADTSLSHGGWVVALTGNYPHSISATTVFYPDGQLAAAQALAAQFTAIGKMAPAPDGVSTTHLTLVLAQDWTSSGK
jgi:LytR cell envelope-related transcriptional attenuator